MNTDCVILAAGFSSRIGKNKMLLEIGGETVIARCMAAFYDSCARIIVVTGRYHDETKQCLAPYAKVQLVYNEKYPEGMFSSVKAGIRQVETERFFLMPGDYPLLKAQTVARLINAPGCYVVPVLSGEAGHPILLSRQLIPAILRSADASLRDCLKSIAASRQEVPVDDIGVVTDIDTENAYRAVVKGVDA